MGRARLSGEREERRESWHADDRPFLWGFRVRGSRRRSCHPPCRLLSGFSADTRRRIEFALVYSFISLAHFFLSLSPSPPAAPQVLCLHSVHSLLIDFRLSPVYRVSFSHWVTDMCRLFYNYNYTSEILPLNLFLRHHFCG